MAKMTREAALLSINCIERVCCPAAASLSQRADFLCKLGADEEAATTIAGEMERLGLAFATKELMQAIADIADHPGRKAAPHAAP